MEQVFALGNNVSGSLDNPPLILRQDRGKIAILQFVSAAFAVFAGWSLWSGTAKSVFWAYVLLVMFGGGAVVITFQLFRPGTLTLDRNGLTWNSGWRTFQYEWSDFSDFIVFSPRWPLTTPGCVYSASSQKHRLGRAITGGIGSFGSCWELPVPEIVDLLNQARVRWGNPK